MKSRIAGFLVCVILIGLACDTSDIGGSSGLSLSGTISSNGTGSKRKAAGREAGEGFVVVAQSAATGEIYRGSSEAGGGFNVEIPDSEQGNTFMVAVIGPNGRASGPVLMDSSAGSGTTGLALDRAASLGTIEIPDDPTTAGIVVGSDGDAGDLANGSATARLDGNGVPVGVASIGKGTDAEGAASGDEAQTNDSDQDGLIDVIDADNDGDGIVDEIDGSDVGGISSTSGIRLNFFMNLKISQGGASTYYEGTSSEVSAALQEDMVITFEVLPEGTASRSPVSIKALETPGPSYLSAATILGEGGGSSTTLWKDVDFAFNAKSDRLDAFVVPHGLVNAGDTFTIEVEFSDGTTEQFSRMINYVFKNIPRLQKHGSPGTLAAFDGSEPIGFDDGVDLVLQFNPPVDETGAYIEGMDYHFEIFYEDAGNSQIQNIDYAATIGSLPGYDSMGHFYSVSADDLALSSSDTYEVTLPAELFPDSVETTSGPEAVTAYKLDIAAQSTGGNAAIMLRFEKN